MQSRHGKCTWIKQNDSVRGVRSKGFDGQDGKKFGQMSRFLAATATCEVECNILRLMLYLSIPVHVAKLS